MSTFAGAPAWKLWGGFPDEARTPGWRRCQGMPFPVNGWNLDRPVERMEVCVPD